MTGPLNHLKIIELGHVIAGPLSAALLSDFGADVIKIEAPNRTDMMRHLGPKAEDGVGVWWKTLGRNKKTLGLDWKSDEGREIPLCLDTFRSVIFTTGSGRDSRVFQTQNHKIRQEFAQLFRSLAN